MSISRRRITSRHPILWVGLGTVFLLGVLTVILLTNDSPGSVPEPHSIVATEPVADQQPKDSTVVIENATIAEVFAVAPEDVWEVCAIEDWPNSKESAHRFVKK